MTLLQMCDSKQFKRCGRMFGYDDPFTPLTSSDPHFITFIACSLCVFDEVEKGVVLYHSYYSVFFCCYDFCVFSFFVIVTLHRSQIILHNM